MTSLKERYYSIYSRSTCKVFKISKVANSVNVMKLKFQSIFYYIDYCKLKKCAEYLICEIHGFRF